MGGDEAHSTGSVELHNQELHVRFSFDKRRVREIKKFSSASFDSKKKLWRLSVDELEQLRKSTHFSPKKLQYAFAIEEALSSQREKAEQRTLARELVLENPFSVPEDILRDSDVEVSFCLSPSLRALGARVTKKSPARKLLKAIPGVHFSRQAQLFIIPVHRVHELITKLRDENILFGMEEKVSVALAQESALRDTIISGEHIPTPDELERTLLRPLVCTISRDDKIFFEIARASNEELAKLFPKVPGTAARRSMANSLSESQLVNALERARESGIICWQSQSVREYFEEHTIRFESYLTAHATDFDQRLLNVHQPKSCWMLLSEKTPALLLEQGDTPLHTFAEKHSVENHPFMPHASTAYQFAEPGILDVLDALETQSESVPAYRSKRFSQCIDSLRQRREKLRSRDEHLAASDMKLEGVDDAIANRLYPHQRIAVHWLLETPRGMLGDDMGLGKTLSLLTYFSILRTRGVSDFLLVVCPNSLVQNWLREATQWFPALRLKTLPSEKKKRDSVLRNTDFADLDGLIVNFELARLETVFPTLKKKLTKRQSLLCIDESQRAKNHQSKTFTALSELAQQCPRRTLLTGTPTPKDITDIWSQILLLDDGERFGSNYYEWLETVAELGTKWSRVAIRSYKEEAVAQTVERVHEILLRRRKEDVIDLPEKTFVTRDIALRGDQKQRFNEIRKELLLRVTNTSGDHFFKEIRSILEEYLRAVQIASNPRLIDPAWQGEPAKFTELDAIVDEVVKEREEKLVVWTNYRDNVLELCQRYSAFNAAPFFGDIDPQTRADTIHSFQNEKQPSILVAVPAAGGVGITLTAAQTAVYLDKTWNGEHWMQSIDRLHRIGQQGSVTIISLHASKIDWLISGNVDKKARTQAKLLGDESSGPDAHIPTREELLEAVQSMSSR